MSQDLCIRARNVQRSFGSLQVLRGVDLDVVVGQVVTLYGPSGSGKTTLLNLIGALDHPQHGTLTVLGKDLLALNEDQRARLRRTQIGFIFQSATLLPAYTALENIDLALRLPGLGYRERKRRAEAALQAVGLNAWTNHLPEELSGGQRQRVAIARALALRARLVLADEPTSGLDTASSRRILALLRAIAAAEQTTFLLVTHDQMLAEFADQVYDLVDGTIAARPRAVPMEAPEHATL
ncbi:MAG: ATP-binding cassette domain-containing protein [Anaerolineae bacterium]|nr:ATP-binding cassette domain-containing protein [Anaerolineae bacterium]